MVFDKSKWIWINECGGEDEYAEFVVEFSTDENYLTVNISSDSDYALFINGYFVDSNQYGDYEHYKIYDSIKIDKHLKNGNNILSVIGYHCGVPTSRYKPAKAGIIFEVVANDGKVICCSDEKTFARKSLTYISGRKSFISGQLGFNFAYDARNEDEWTVKVKQGFESAVVIDKKCTFFERPIKKQYNADRIVGKIIKNDDNNHFLVDLGKEYVGLPYIDIDTKVAQNIVVAFGEHLRDGKVMMTQGAHEFKYEYFAKAGKNSFVEYMLRIGCRYLEVFTTAQVDFIEVGLIQQYYPIDEKQCKINGEEIDSKIYDVCLRTLKLCMMEHYVDCPWREQSLYAFDSRNQMLCGYYAFENGNATYVKANLKLISEDRRKDNLLSICFPCGVDLCIPSFSLHYITAVEEYLSHTGDIKFVISIYEKLNSIIDAFIKNMSNGLVRRFGKNEYWDFYDWSDYMVGTLGSEEPSVPDSVINCLVVIALEKMKIIADKCGLSFKYDNLTNEIRLSIRENFYDKVENAISVNVKGNEFCELSNALGVLANVFNENEKKSICDKLVSDRFVACSLSMKIFKYQALLSVDKNKYENAVLSSIRKDYKKMLDAGATSVWETVDGADDFGGCGSLCHGWSAVPIYIYNLLGMVEYL